MDKESLLKIAEEKIKESLLKSGMFVQTVKKTVQEQTATLKQVLKEALVVVPRGFILKTEKLSHRTKEAHEGLYKEYVDAFNKTSSKLDTSLRNSDEQAFRSLKADEVYNFNAVKLHELYFTNISDLSSEIRVDSIPYMRLARDWGTFDNWQLDFRATCLASREGWAVTVFDPYRNVYQNIAIDGHAVNVPVGCIPVIVMDMWAHSYYRDYLSDKKAYVNGMMKELSWNIIEARMTIVERANLHNLYLIQPIVNSEPERLLSQAESQESPPIGKDQVQVKQAQYNDPNSPPPTGQQQGMGGSGPSSTGGEY